MQLPAPTGAKLARSWLQTADRGQEPAQHRDRRTEYDETCHPPATQSRLQQQDDPNRSGEQATVHHPQGSLTLDVLAKHLCMILERERAYLDAILDIFRDSAQRT